jgi:hypothetical protein
MGGSCGRPRSNHIASHLFFFCDHHTPPVPYSVCRGMKKNESVSVSGDYIRNAPTEDYHHLDHDFYETMRRKHRGWSWLALPLCFTGDHVL